MKVQTHYKSLSITGTWQWDLILGHWMALPLSFSRFLLFDNKICAVPILNSIQSMINVVYFYYYFAVHSIDESNEALLIDGTKFDFSEQEIYKIAFYIIFNILTIAVEIPFFVTSCFNNNITGVTKDESYKLHMFNQGLLSIFLLYSYYESFSSYLFFGEYLWSTYFGTVGFWGLASYIQMLIR